MKPTKKQLADALFDNWRLRFNRENKMWELKNKEAYDKIREIILEKNAIPVNLINPDGKEILTFLNKNILKQIKEKYIYSMENDDTIAKYFIYIKKSRTKGFLKEKK